MQISDRLDGGNIRVLGMSDDDTATLEIVPDPGTDFLHWFHFQCLQHGHPPEAPGSADLSIGANWVQDRFGCLAVTLEQSFKDLADKPLTDAGWSPGHSRRLGMSVLDAIAAVLASERTKESP